MIVHKTLKRLAAASLAITLVGGAVPANIGAFDLSRSTSVVASAESEISISNATVTMKAHSAKVQSVELNGTKLQKDIDYTVSYSQTDSDGKITEFSAPPKQTGNYNAVITGIGDYQGVITRSFDIVGSGYEGISIIDGSQGSDTPSNEHLFLIFDKNRNTKMCSKVNRAGIYANRDSDWLLFEADTPFAIHNYVLTTANDTSHYTGRNWKSWRIYGSNSEAAADYTASYTEHKVTDIDEDIWSLVQQVTDDTVLQPVNYTEFAYAVPHNKNKYKYYLLILDDIVDTSNNIQQMSEIEFNAALPVSVTHVDAVPADCLNAGNIEHWYDEYNDKYYLDEDAQNEVDEEDVIIPASGHSYGRPEWNYDAKNQTVTATFKCENCEDVQTVDATITSKTTSPTYVKEGKIVYTASVKLNGQTYTTNKTVIIDKLTYTPPTITSLKGYGAVKLQWTDVKGAEKYAVAGFISGKWRILDQGEGTSYVLKNLLAGKEYKVCVATKLNGEWFTDPSNAIVVTPKLKPVKDNPAVTFEKGKNTVKLSWDAVEGAEKYAVAGYINGRWKILAEGVGNSYVLKDLKAGYQYKVAVSAMFNGKWNTDLNNAITVTPK
ncbi:fibronectin type III domain-containing protein [Ruminococcus albus]|uniref:Fibronectin type-III domain-containing protein n=1 Tax=Ruminococcus albus (strain ATCC 27210 / DSM 20455 / JCM 14654 / NCDO 2250 / 7) TaxID=697329 RepID=E6UFM9_RUMA7|nr:fibronectin type III domain-containing protein [Ruminococcus albus]ADU23018.1 hypothetical protein Rumal_2543 [Ruminococcus albus 7 = DSM 20455]